MRRLPPLKALRAFEAAARRLSFKAAADELGLTPTAISHQIRLLESATGLALFRRRPRPLTLTSAGARLLPVVRGSFDTIAETFDAMRDEAASLQPETADIGSHDSGNANTSPFDATGPRPKSIANQPTSGPPRLSLVVLPFTDIGGDHEQEYFADGITESLTTDLSRISGAFVIGHNTAFLYKGSTIDLRQIGRDLNVRYALQGSVRRSGNRLRINVQLIECNAATHLWAERFDQTVDDLFEMQDELVARLAGQLGVQLVEAEARHAERSPDPDSVDLYFRAKSLINRGPSAEYLKPAEALLRQALQLDPNNVDALAAMGWVDLYFGAGYVADDRPAARLASAEANATRALSLAPDHAFAHLVLGTFYGAVNRGDEAIDEFEHALILDRNLVHAHALIGTAKTALGRAEEADNHYREALRLSPRDVAAHHWMSSTATSKLHLAKDEEAVMWFRRAIEANRNFAFSHLSLAAALAHLGRVDEARVAAKAGLELEPNFTIARHRASARSQNPVYLGGRERIYDGMRRASIPE
jgi:TolB-like protein/Flp pilus assembly protein TadD